MTILRLVTLAVVLLGLLWIAGVLFTGMVASGKRRRR